MEKKKHFIYDNNELPPMRVLIGVCGKVLRFDLDGFLTTDHRCIGDLSSWGQSMVTKKYTEPGYDIGTMPMFWEEYQIDRWDHVEYFLVEFEWGGHDGYVKNLVMDIDKIVERLLD